MSPRHMQDAPGFHHGLDQESPGTGTPTNTHPCPVSRPARHTGTLPTCTSPGPAQKQDLRNPHAARSQPGTATQTDQAGTPCPPGPLPRGGDGTRHVQNGQPSGGGEVQTTQGHAGHGNPGPQSRQGNLQRSNQGPPHGHQLGLVRGHVQCSWASGSPTGTPDTTTSHPFITPHINACRGP